MANQFLSRSSGSFDRGWWGNPLLSLQREVDRLFDDVLRAGTSGSEREPAGMLVPQVNVSETDKELRITAELPGVSDKDIDVSLDGDMLTIRAEKKLQRKEEKEDFHFVERSFGSFQRAIRIPFSAEPDKVRARLENGVLTVTIPKSEAQARARRIEVQGSESQSDQSKGAETSH
jgi:HSP20 family protein